MHPEYSFEISLSAAASAGVFNNSQKAIGMNSFVRHAAHLDMNVVALGILINCSRAVVGRYT
jgi:hypothetical protein